MGAAGDGRAPTEEHSCVRGWDFCSTDVALPDGGCLVSRVLHHDPIIELLILR
jgi:hypothetical protein